MIIDLVGEFLEVLAANDSQAAYRQYLQKHEALLSPWWHNYVIDLDSAQAPDIIRNTLAGSRADLEHLLATTDLSRLAAQGLEEAGKALHFDLDLDVVLMVGVGAANAAELVVQGRGLVVISVEHFTGHANPDTYSLGLAPELIPMWIAHEAAHVVRYCSPTSRSDLKRLIAESGGTYDCWELAGRASLRELLLNEGLAVHAARAAAPGFADEAYYGYTRRQFRRLRELDTFLLHAAQADLDHAALGLRLRYLTGGMAPAARLVHGRVLPERSGYYLGARLAEALVAERGIDEAVRAAVPEFIEADSRRPLGEAASA